MANRNSLHFEDKASPNREGTPKHRAETTMTRHLRDTGTRQWSGVTPEHRHMETQSSTGTYGDWVAMYDVETSDNDETQGHRQSARQDSKVHDKLDTGTYFHTTGTKPCLSYLQLGCCCLYYVKLILLWSMHYVPR